jgi:hypothetical protein
MTICIFTGPTLPPAEAAKILAAEYFPPAAIGDVYKAAQKRPWAIGIIDGFFESTPSVWHKEVLWAMARGIHVFGASSMGALRAAELADFGMVGVGAIFEAYRSGQLEDDDEVAVVHAPPELGYVQLSEAMVNIRVTLKKAADEGVLPPPHAAALTDIAKSLYYKNRSYDRVLAEGAARQLPGDALARLKAWLPHNQVNQKRLDAIAMLEAIGRAQAAELEPKTVSYVFEHTTLWDSVEQEYGSASEPAGNDRAPVPSSDLLDEIRLDGALYPKLRRDALLRALARQDADRRGLSPTVEQLQEATRRFSKHMGLRSPAELEDWLQRRGMSRDEFLCLMGDDIHRQRLEESLTPAAASALVDELRANGDYVRLQERAQHKRDILMASGAEGLTLDEGGPPEPALVSWIVEECLPQADDVAPEELARHLGFVDRSDLLRAARREYWYRAKQKA